MEPPPSVNAQAQARGCEKEAKEAEEVEEAKEAGKESAGKGQRN